MTVKDNPWVKKEPTQLPDGSDWYGPHPKQQRFLLHAYAREVFYGGAGGGGKSQSLWYAALQYVDVPGYAALILRRTYADLAKPGALMDRSKEYLAGTGAQWNERDKRWTFPSGATITFGYLQNEADKYQYASAEFQYIAFDELTHFTKTQYTFLFTRLRKKKDGPLADVPLRMRSASNPGARGHQWVKDRFVNPKTRRPGVVFIPASLKDNPSIAPDEYRASLSHTDPLTRRQIEEGDWDAVAQGRFKPEWLRYYRRHGSGLALLSPGEGRHLTAADLRTRFLTVDPAASVPQTAKDDPDWTVISAWALAAQGDLVWLGCLRLRAEIPDIAPRVAEQYLRHRADKVYVEGFGIGKGPLDLVRRQPLRPGGQERMNVVPLNPAGKDKLANAAAALNLAEAGRVWLPADDPVFPLEEVESELLRFTGAAGAGHDDVWDTFGQAGRVAQGHAFSQTPAAAAPFIVRT